MVPTEGLHLNNTTMMNTLKISVGLSTAYIEISLLTDQQTSVYYEGAGGFAQLSLLQQTQKPLRRIPFPSSSLPAVLWLPCNRMLWFGISVSTAYFCTFQEMKFCCYHTFMSRTSKGPAS